MPPEFGVFVEGTQNASRYNPDLEKKGSYVTIKVQILFSSISYTKFLKQKTRSTTFITKNKQGSASDYFLYCAEQWPENDGYNDPVDQVIFIDCGSDDLGSATANSENEEVLRKYISFAVMRLKDMLYRRSRLYSQRGKVECMILSIFPFHKCMIAMSALLGKMLSDSDIYVSFTADVLSRPEYFYTFNWIHSYGWKFDVYYNAAFSPYKGSVEASTSPKMKLQEIDRLCNATTGFSGSMWRFFESRPGMPSIPYWRDKNYHKDENGNVKYGNGGASQQDVILYDETEIETKTYDGKEIKLTDWVPQKGTTKVWVPDDPAVVRWQDPNTGRGLVRYNNQIFDRNHLYDYWHSATHPSYDELYQRIGETHKAYDEALQREKEVRAGVWATRVGKDWQFTREYIDKEVDNLVKNTGITHEEAQKRLAAQGFILQDKEGTDMFFHDGRMLSNEQLTNLEKAAEAATAKAKDDYEKAIKALELRKTSDCLFILNAGALVIGVVSFGATTPLIAGAFAIVDFGLNITIVCFQIREAHVQGKNTLEAFGDSTGERIFNIGLTTVALIADVFTFGHMFFNGNSLIKATHAKDLQPYIPSAKDKAITISHHPEVQAKTPAIKQSSADLPQATHNSSEVPQINETRSGTHTETPPRPQTETLAAKPAEMPIIKDSSSTPPVTNAKVETVDKPSLYVNEKGEIRVIDSNGNEHKALGIGQSRSQASVGGENSPFGKLDKNGDKAYVKVKREDGKGFEYIEVDNKNAINTKKTYKDKSTWGKKPETKSAQPAANEVDTASPSSNEQHKATDGDTVSSSSNEKNNSNNGVDGSGKSDVANAEKPIEQQSVSESKAQTTSAESQQGTTGKNKSSTPEETNAQPKGNDDPGKSDVTNAENADTPMIQEENKTKDVINNNGGKGGNAASNTGNIDKVFQEMKKKLLEPIGGGMKKSFTEPIGDAIQSIKEFKNGEIKGRHLVKNISIDLAQLVAGLDHWLCIGINIQGIYDHFPGTKDYTDEKDEIELGESTIDNDAELYDDDIINLAGMDPKSLDAITIANDSKYMMTYMEADGLDKDDIFADIYTDYSQMNAAANNVLAAETKVAAAKDYVNIDKEMKKIDDQIGPGNRVDDDTIHWYVDLANEQKKLDSMLNDPNSNQNHVDPNTIVDITEAELQGAQNQLLYQQIIQKDHDNKLKKSDKPDD